MASSSDRFGPVRVASGGPGAFTAPPKPRKRRQRCDTALNRRRAVECRRLYSDEGWSYAALADRYGCGVVVVWKVLSGRTFADVQSPTSEPAPRWRRLEPFRNKSGPAVRLYVGERFEVRSVELLWRAAFEPSTLSPATIARIAPRGPRPPSTIVPPSARPAIALTRPVAPPATIAPPSLPPAAVEVLRATWCRSPSCPMTTPGIDAEGARPGEA